MLGDNKSAYNSFEYDEKICKTLPYYEDFHSQITDLVRAVGLTEINWLDTGCGTGKTAFKALKELDGTKINFTLCDASAEMLKIAEKRLVGGIVYRNIPSQELDYKEEFDVVTAVQCHHYLSLEERKTATKKCFDALKHNGIFITFENIRLENSAAEELAVRRWKSFMISNGRSPEEAEKQLERRGKEYFPITVEEHKKLLKDCGFRSAQPLWFSYLQAGFFAIK